MTKEDYMHIPAERLAELLVEKDDEIKELRKEIESVSGAGMFDPSKFYKPNQGPNIWDPNQFDKTAPYSPFFNKEQFPYPGWPINISSGCVSSTWKSLGYESETKETNSKESENFNGVGIQHIDGTIYSLEDWKTNEFKPKMARGIAVGDGKHSLCLWKNCGNNIKWSSDISVKVPGVITTTDKTVAANDFSGKANTDSILAAVSAGTIEDAPAAQWARNNTFGSEAYLPAAGELVMITNNKDKISLCSTLIDGNLQDMFKSEYWYLWSSTQYAEISAWAWDSINNELYYGTKNYGRCNRYALGCVAL